MSDESTRIPAQSLHEASAVRADLRSAVLDLELVLALSSDHDPADWLARLATQTGRVQEVFNDHLSVTEGECGLFSDIVAQAPRLACRVHSLEAEHDVILSQLNLLAHDCVCVEPDLRTAAEHAAASAAAVVAAIERHRARGLALVHDAFDIELGGE